MKPSEKNINSVLNTIVGKKYPEVHFDFSYYDEDIYGGYRLVSNIYMSAPESYYEKHGDDIKHYEEIESEVRTILKMFGFTSIDPIYSHWISQDHFE